MEFKVVPFTAQITRSDTATTVANQMQTIIDSHVAQEWEYIRMDSVQTSVAGSAGCFGIGSEAAFTTSFNVLIFKKRE